MYFILTKLFNRKETIILKINIIIIINKSLKIGLLISYILKGITNIIITLRNVLFTKRKVIS